MAILFKNNAASTLTYKMTDAQEVLYVADASVFPVITPDSGDTFKLTLVGDDTLEIVEAFDVYNPEGRQGFKIRRAQEGTPAQAWPVDTRVEMRITAGALDSFVPTAVQIAKDNVDAIGVASTTNVGFAGVDGQTTQAAADGTISVKDVAIGGNLENLASARGQVGDAAIINSPDYNTLLKSGLYHCTFAGAQNGPGNFATKLHVIARGEHIVQVAYQGSAPGIFMRTSGDGGALWSAWTPAITTNRVGDGIRVTNGIISVPEMQGATASTDGTSGLVPAVGAGDQDKLLAGDGTWKNIFTLPIGLIYAYTGTDVPAGGLRLNGQTLENCDTMLPDFYNWVLTNGIRGTLAEYTTALTAYDDQCGFFGVDEDTKTVRLPKLTHFLGAAVDVSEFGTAQLAGLPNITGSVSATIPTNPVNTGAMYTDEGGSGAVTSQGSYKVVFDASHVNPIYGRSTTVTPANVRYPYIIHVYSSAVSASVAQATEFAGLVDGLRSDVPALAAHAAMPSKRNIEISLNPFSIEGNAVYVSTTEYTAPADGYVQTHVIILGNGQHYSAINTTTTSIIEYTNASSDVIWDLCLPISKGEIAKIVQKYSTSCRERSAHFVYAQGAE